MLLLGCFRRLAGLVIVLLLLAVGLWWFRDDVSDAWRRVRGGETVAEAPSPEVAERAEEKLADLGAGRSERVALSGVELQSLVLYSYGDLFPAFVREPRVDVEEGRLRLDARVPTDALGSLPGAAQAQALLPDTADVTIVADLLPLGDGRAALAVDEITAARIPVPSAMVPRLLERMGRVSEPGLPEDALAVRLPPGVGSAYMRGDSLILQSTATPRAP